MGNGQGCDETATRNVCVVIVYALMPPIIAQSRCQVKTPNEDALEAGNGGQAFSSRLIASLVRSYSLVVRGDSWFAPSRIYPAEALRHE